MSKSSRKSISLLGEVYGQSQPGLLDFLTTEPCGPAPVLVKVSASPEKEKASTMSDTCGHIFTDSLPLVDPKSSLESKSPLRCAGRPRNKISAKKLCNACGREKTRAEFSKDLSAADGLSTQCKQCRSDKQKQRRNSPETRQDTLLRYRNYRKKYRGEKRGFYLVKEARARAKKMGLSFDLDDFKIQIQQRVDNGICEMTGMRFNLEGGRTWDSPSLDRIDSTKGYEITNVRVVILAVNIMMSNWGQEKVLEVARALQEKEDQKKNSFGNRLEQNLMRKINEIGSTEFSWTWKRVNTPSGHSVLQLVPSMRRTSGSDSTGAPWTTPCSDDTGQRTKKYAQGGTPLSMQAGLMAPWSTPTVQDSENTAGPSQFQRNSQALNVQAVTHAAWPTPTTPSGGQVAPGGTTMTGRTPDGKKIQVTTELVARASGLMPSGSPETTEKRGVLNPEFACWLMGFPEEWVSSALRAMLSYRPSRRSSSKP